jgi:molecular chaperone GrpE
MTEAIDDSQETKTERAAGTHESDLSVSATEPEQPTHEKKRRKAKDVRVSEKEFNELKEKAALADEYYDRLLRLQADFENFRKRKEKERLEMIKYATEELVCELVPVLSNFERALAAAENLTHARGFMQGIELILKQLKKVLQERGIEEICPLDAPFDPYKHEAVDRVVTDEHPDGHVLEVFQKGYALNDRVLQPAAVKVAAAPETDDQEPPPGEKEKDKGRPGKTVKIEIASEDNEEEGEQNG